MSPTVLIAAALVLVNAGPTIFVPASDASITYAGRTRINADGSRSFDWEGTSMFISVTGATFVSIHVNTTGNAKTRLVCNTSSGAGAEIWVDRTTNGAPQLIARALSAGAHSVSAFNSVEPMYNGATATSTFNFMGFSTDGVASTTPPRAHNIEFIGDSITAGVPWHVTILV